MAFLWGAAGEKLTQKQASEQRKIAQALLSQASDTSPVGHWTAALNRGLQGYLGGRQSYLAREGEKLGDEHASSIYKSLPGMGGGSVASALAGGGAPVAGGGVGSSFLDSLFQNESGGNFGALNSEGYGGRGQFGAARLADAAAAGIIPAGIDGAAFSKMPPEVQQAVENWHFQDIENQAARMGLDQYIGQEVGGVPVTMDAIKAMAHLGGIGGAAKFLQTGGQYNPADSNGTRLSHYGLKHGRVGSVADTASVGAAPAAGGGSAALLAAMADPHVAERYGPQIQAMLGQAQARENAVFEQQLAAQDPMRQLQLEKGQIELEQMRRGSPDEYAQRAAAAGQFGLQDGTPEFQTFVLTGEIPSAPSGPTSVQEYQFYQQDAASRGEPVAPYNQWLLDQSTAKSSKTNVSVGGLGETPFTKTLDEKFAPEAQTWLMGGASQVEQNLSMLDESLSILERGGNVTGAVGLLPGPAQAFFNPDGTIAKDNVAAVVQNTLKDVLGSSFTEAEGERILARAFNPTLSPEENAKRVRRLMSQIRSAAAAKQAMTDYAMENGTLRGYSGPQPNIAGIEKATDEEVKAYRGDSAGLDLSQATLDDLAEIDIDSLSPEERRVLASRIRSLKNGQ